MKAACGSGVRLVRVYAVPVFAEALGLIVFKEPGPSTGNQINYI